MSADVSDHLNGVPVRNPDWSAAFIANVEVEYREFWDDGYGAQGWKIRDSIGDPRVVASSAHAGPVSPTNVLVHDILDHHLCGLSIGGHRNEVVATLLHAMRNGLAVEKSIDMMVSEFMATGYCGGPIWEFIPEDLRGHVSSQISPERMPTVLADILGREGFRYRLVHHYYRLGIDGLMAALLHYQGLGLSLSRRHDVGMHLQQLFESAEGLLRRNYLPQADGIVGLSDKACGLMLCAGDWSCTL